MDPPFSIGDLCNSPARATCVNRGISEDFGGLPKRQEERFIDLFWPTYLSIMPVLSEEEFRKHFELLWNRAISPEHSRENSPLVDIVLAISIQYGRNFIHFTTSIDDFDSIYVSVWYYQRCIDAICHQWEHPTITTVQCYIFAIMYLQNCPYLDLAYTTLGVAIRIAQTLGLHLEQPGDLSQYESELRKRIWYGLYIIDTRISAQLGRPWTIETQDSTFSLPTDHSDFLPQAHNGVSHLPDGISCLNFFVQSIKLCIAMRSAHTDFYTQSRNIFAALQVDDIYSNGPALDACATLLKQCLVPLGMFIQKVPKELQILRRDSGSLLYADVTQMQIDSLAPKWLQVQQLSLELAYHNSIITLCRPLIQLTPITRNMAPQPNIIAMTALNHAIAVANFVQKVLIELDFLVGWYDALHVQWEASLTILAYSLAYPLCDLTPGALRALALSATSFDLWGANCPTPAKAAATLRKLAARAKEMDSTDPSWRFLHED